MNGSTFASYIRKKTGTNSTTLSDADIVLLANVEKDDLAEEVVANIDERYFEMELTRDIEVDTRNYTFPNDVLKHVKFIQAKLDGTNWSPLDEEDFSHLKDTAILTESYVKERYASKKPAYWIKGRELVILSGDDIIAVTNGLKMLAEVYPEDITTGMLALDTDLSIPSSTQAHSLPRALHKMWATKVIVSYKQSRDKPIPLTQQEQKLEDDLQDALKKLHPRNLNRSFLASTPVDDGENY